MKRLASKFHPFLCLLVTASIMLSGLANPVFSQGKPVVITFGQPNIWSLEQAHYLLARMHRQNLDLQTAALGDLDPNATNASRIDILKTLLEVGVKFDQAVALNNQLLKSDKVFNSGRRQELLTNRSTLQAESTQLARDIAALKIAKADAKTDAERAAIQAQIDAKTEEKTAVDNQITQTNTELTGLTSASGDFQRADVTDSFSSTKLTGDLDSLINKVQLINPTIAASLRLENHIQMQYEIIAKQLTLLRDEVGPGERLVFLELPQSLSATQDKAEGKVAQAWWRIAGYTRVNKEKMLEHEQEILGKEIATLRTDKAVKISLADEYRDNRTQLTEQLKDLCSEKAKRERELEEVKKRLEESKKLKEMVDKDLAEAEELLAKADQGLAAAEKLRDDAARELASIPILRSNRRARRRAEEKVRKATAVAADAEANSRAASAKLEQAQRAKSQADANREKLCEELVHNIEQLNSSVGQFDNTIKDTQEAIQRVDDRQIRLQKETVKLSQAFTSLSTKYEKLQLELTRKKIKEHQNRADRLLQGGGVNTSEVVSKTIELLNSKPETIPSLGFEKVKDGNKKDIDGREYSIKEAEGREDEGRKYVNLDLFAAASETEQERLRGGQSSYQDKSVLRNRSVRTIDIIPRQNAVNVNDTKQKVSKTGIFAAVSFLFGFAGKFGYQRQREQAQQFLNQELFTSGFGKGETDFGWSFYPYAGSKQLAPGVRTTYAVAVIPKDAESLVLKARGCYFPRKQNQPLNYDVAGGSNWTLGHAEESNCTEQEQVFILPVPGGSGDGADYYVTGMWFSPHRKPGERMVASIYGQNFPTQMGVLVNGVALTESVGLGQLGIESVLGDKVRENCVAQICGRFERIDPNQIVISFSMPNDFKRTPLIALIGPGKEIELNKLNLNINGNDDAQLSSSEWMFGAPATEASRSIDDFKVAPATTRNQMTGVLSGGKFKLTDTIFVNGFEAKTSKTVCKRPDLCLLTFPVQETDFLTVTVAPEDKDEEAISRTFVNPTSLSIISSAVVSNEVGDATHPAVLTVKLDGSGFKNALLVKANDVEIPETAKLVTSPGQMILRIVSPERVTQVTLKDRDNNKLVSTVVVRP